MKVYINETSLMSTRMLNLFNLRWTCSWRFMITYSPNKFNVERNVKLVQPTLNSFLKFKFQNFHIKQFIIFIYLKWIFSLIFFIKNNFYEYLRWLVHRTSLTLGWMLNSFNLRWTCSWRFTLTCSPNKFNVRMNIKLIQPTLNSFTEQV